MTAAVEACALVRELEALLETLTDKIARVEACKATDGNNDDKHTHHIPRSMLGSSLALKEGALPHPYHAHHSRQQQERRWQQQPLSPPLVLQETQRSHMPPKCAPSPSPESTFLALTGHQHEAPPTWSASTEPQPPPPTSLPTTRAPLASVKEALENLKRVESSAAARKASQQLISKWGQS